MREGSYYKKNPLVLESIGDEPIESAEKSEVADQEPVEAAAEQPASVFNRGEARFEKAGAFLNSLKDRAKNFFAKIPQVAGTWSRTAAVGILSTPEIAREGAQRVAATGEAIQENLEGGATAVMRGVANAGESISGGVDAGVLWAMDSSEALASYAKTKQEDFGNYLVQKGAATKAVAELASNYTAEKAASARAGIETGISSVSEWGARSLAAAEAKRQAAMNSFRQKLTDARYEQLRRDLEKAAADREAANTRFMAISQKMQFRAALG